MVEGATSPFQSSSGSLSIADKNLLEFYQRKFDEFQKKEDKYREKVDKHLRDLISDRHELEAEVLRRGEKISDLQKALVDLQICCFEERERFLKVSAENEELKIKEEKLHENIRQLLSMTQQKDLRDRIIYILKEPRVEIGYRTEDSRHQSSSGPTRDSATSKLQEQLKFLQSQLNEYCKFSKSRSDVVLEDCKLALQKSREKIKQDEIEINKLQQKLLRLDQEYKSKFLKVQQECENKIVRLQQKYESRFSKSGLRCDQDNDNNHESSESKESYDSEKERKSSGSKSDNILNMNDQHKSVSLDIGKGSVENSHVVKSGLRDMHLSLVLTSKILFKLQSIVKSVQTTKIFLRMSYASRIPEKSEEFVKEIDVTQLQAYVRQCSRLSYDLCNMHKSLNNEKFSKELKYKDNLKESPFLNLDPELEQLELILKDLAISATEADLLAISLTQASFFDVLKGVKPWSENLTNRVVKSPNKYVSDFRNLVGFIKSEKELVSRAINLTEKAIKKFCGREHHSELLETQQAGVHQSPEQKSHRKLEQDQKTSGTYKSIIHHASAEDLERSVETDKRKIQEAENLGYMDQSEINLLKEKLKITEELLRLEREEKTLLQLQDKTHSQERAQQTQFQDKAQSQDIAQQTQFQDKYQSQDSAQQTQLQDKGQFQDRAQQTQRQERFQHKAPLRDKDQFQDRPQKTQSQERFQHKAPLQDTDHFHSQQLPKSQKSVSLSSDSTLSSTAEDVIKHINKTLSKVQQIESGEYFIDDELCRHLEEKVNDLTARLKDLSAEFSMKHLQDQFSEYSSLTLSKLEALAKQSRDSLIAAECQIATHRSNAKLLSDKLRESEELLRESINECLSLKQKLKLEEKQREIEKATLIANLSEKLDKVTGFEDLETFVNEMVSSFTQTKPSKKTIAPFECMCCRQGAEHKLCNEKIKDLSANSRKLATELKLLRNELKQEQDRSKMNQEEMGKVAAELTNEKEKFKGTVHSLEVKNSSLMEQLKLERNRLKNMERFRRLEIEGFQTDIKNLKSKIKDLEKQLMKAVLIFEHDNKGLELLKSVHETAQRSKQAAGDIRRLKAKLYELENDIKNL